MTTKDKTGIRVNVQNIRDVQRMKIVKNARNKQSIKSKLNVGDEQNPESGLDVRSTQDMKNKNTKNMHMSKKKERTNRQVHKMNRFAPFVISVLLLVVWFLVCQLELFSPYVLPTPEKVLDTFLKMFHSGELFEDIFVSFGRVLKGFLIAFMLAFSLGMFRVLVPKAEKYYDFILEFFRNVPPLSMIPLLILWCGIGELTKTVIIVLASFFPMYLNIVKGFTGCEKSLLEVGDVFGYTPFEKFTKIMLPYAVSDILVGMRIGMGYSWRAIIGAEMVAASTGLGHMILFAQQMSRTDKVIVGILVIGIVGILTDKIFVFIIQKCRKYQ